MWTLLIADDCAEDREIYREYLSSDPDQSYQILEASSAEGGLTLFQKQHFDAILLDFCLPDMTGLEFLDELKHQGWEAPFPVIMLTGQGDERVAVQALKRGAQDYLVKQHLEPDMLQLSVRSVIQQSHLQSQFEKVQERRHLIAEIALRIHQTLNLEQIVQMAVTEVHQLLECDRVTLYQATQSSDKESLSASVFQLTKLCETGLKNSVEPNRQFVSFLNQNYPLIPKATVLTSRKRKHAEVYLLVPILFRLKEQEIALNSSRPPGTSLWGLLVACRSSGNQRWHPDEIEMFSELAEHLAIAIKQSQQLAQALTALESEKQLNTLKSQFVATVSREYRTLLSSILAAASTLKVHKGKLDETKYLRFLQLIEDKARQMAQLVEDLLVIEAFESDKTSFKPYPFEVLQFFSDIIEEQRRIINSVGADSPARHELIFKITGNTRGFWGDQALLRQVLVNLLVNAIKYSPDGGSIEVHLIGTESHLIFEVKDEGIGIPTEDQERLFQFLSRGSNVGNIPGSGLGLAIVKTCVDLHGGEVAVDSQLGKGTKITVRLPKYNSSVTEGGRKSLGAS
ncbi:ATP-binding protein [Leptothermofonsia sp. ETS-13]|uniref:ATP-binding protein n=1 Tax=Leptothermofonsia sp. ETS-13 TaxID=3035696 RepID=UPI003BA3A2A7